MFEIIKLYRGHRCELKMRLRFRPVRIRALRIIHSCPHFSNWIGMDDANRSEGGYPGICAPTYPRTNDDNKVSYRDTTASHE